MLKPYLVVGTHKIRIHVDIAGRQCECPVFEQDGIALIIAPQVWEIERELRDNGNRLLPALQRIDPMIRQLRMSRDV